MTISTILALSLIAHLVGDYLIQNNWMALEKTKRLWPAVVHGVTYTLPFLILTQSIPALLIICVTHIIIDRYRLAKYVVWAKNQLAPKAFRPPRSAMKTTGFSEETPVWLATWLMFIADNTIHLVINALALVYLGTVWTFV